MGTVAEFTVQSTSDAGGRAISRFHGTLGAGSSWDTPTGSSAESAIKAFYDAIKADFPTTYTWTVQQLWEEFDEVTGVIQRSNAASSQLAGTIGTGIGAYAGGSGARVYWHTAVVRNRRVVRGATYVTPFVQVAYTTSGQLTTTVQAAVAAAGNALVSAFNALGASLVVWSRPTTVHPSGATSPIVNASCGPQAGSLRSRRF